MLGSNGKSLSRRNWLGAVTGTMGALSAAPALYGQDTNRDKKKLANNWGTKIYNIKDFGAKGDGQTLDTAAIQAAIDNCHNELGGTVLIPAGVFVTGTIELKSNVKLHISAQGKILGTADGKQYYAASAIPTAGEWTMGDGNVGLIFAANAENITIEGNGTIDGQGAQFRSAVRGALPPSGISGNKRPHHLLFYQCTNLTIRDIFLTACAYHSVRICLSRFVKLDGVRIYSRVNGNNDGFHFISCEHVHLSNSNVQCQDDACALFGSNKFITITNSSFSTRWSVFRFGGGFSENITVSNCLIYETWGCPIKIRCDHRSRFENISFSNIVMKDVTGPISIGLGPQNPKRGETPEKPGIVRNISFSNIQVTVSKPVRHKDISIGGDFNPGEIFSCVILNGMGEGFLENISFNNVNISFPGGGTAAHAAVRNVPKIAGEYYVIGIPPAYGIFARNVHGLTLNNVRLQLRDEDLRPALVLENTADVMATGLSIDGNMGAESTIRLIQATDIYMQSVRLLKPSNVFLQVEGSASKNIKIDGGDLSKASKTFSVTASAGKNAVRIRE